MRILYILNTLAVGGAERLVLMLGERMAARGHAVRILVLGPKSHGEWPTALDVVRLGMRKPALASAPALLRAVREVWAFRPDVIHGNNFHGNLLARMLKLARPSVRVISTLHNEYEGGRGRMLALKWSDACTERTIAVSHAVAERAVELRIVPARKCSVITNGIDAGMLQPDAKRRAAVRRAMDARDDFVWLSAGRLAEAKDVPNLLNAFAQVRSEAPAIQLWIAGTGDEEYADALRIRAMELNVDEGVQWLGLRDDIPGLLDAADAFVLGSAWEGMPLAVAEAMAMEKPVVATGVGGVSELIANCGLVVPPRDATALARAIMSVLNTPAEARQFLGRSARERVAEKFSIEAKAEEWERVYTGSRK